MKLGRKKKVIETTIESGENAIANKEVEGLSQGQIVLSVAFCATEQQ
jgi:hypothetical protein